MRKVLSFVLSFAALVPAMAQEASAPGDTEHLNRSLLVILFGLVIFLLVIVVLVLFQLTMLMEKKSTVATPVEERTSIWLSLLGLKPIAKEKELILDEDFDGIHELNNPVPGWFNALFYGTIGIGIVYMLVFHVWKTSDLQDEEYNKEVQLAEVQREEYLKKFANNIDENSVVLATKEADLAKGKDVFAANCASCHGQQGEGLVGPNLTDPYWLHGGTISDVFKTVKYGVPAKGMISWDKKLNPLQLQQVSSYILSLQGTNPPNGKEPQGEKVGEGKLSMN